MHDFGNYTRVLFLSGVTVLRVNFPNIGAYLLARAPSLWLIGALLYGLLGRSEANIPVLKYTSSRENQSC